MIITSFLIEDKERISCFFEETFLLADTSMEVVLRTLFLTLSLVKIDFTSQYFNWRTYITTKVLPIMRHVKLIGKKKFVAITLNLNNEAFIIVHVAFIDKDSDVHLLYRAQIAVLKTDKTSISILSKYSDFAGVFFKKLVAKLLEYIKINNYTIDLIEKHQPLYGFIYSLRQVKLEILKTYININLTNSFIKLFKSPIGAFILFVRKPNRSLQLYVNYKCLINLTFKNWYPLLLIGESLN